MDVRPRGMATIDTTKEGLFFDASEFDEQDVRIYQIDPESGGDQAWVLRLTGPLAHEKAEAIAKILRGET